MRRSVASRVTGFSSSSAAAAAAAPRVLLRLASFATLIGAVGCGAERPAAPSAPTAVTTANTTTSVPLGAPPTKDNGRLPGTATPERYAVSLTIDPTQPRFSGTVAIMVDVAQPTSFVVLHGRDLHVVSATARQGDARFAASTSTRMAHGGLHEDELVLSFAAPLAKGKATIEIAYDAPFADDLAALYRVKDGERWYAFTQFESTDARRAFPCFDEPGFKTAYDISITAPKGMIAVANAPETIHKDAGAMTTFGFATTRPLPSYLVAFAVGDFDIKQGATSPVPIRLIATKGKAKLGDLALEATAALSARLGAYFDVRYPYEKLDIVAVPDFAAGAMENPGLITFRQELLLLDPQSATTGVRRAQAEVIAHELAHMWFGDLVTMQWWDDLWLNEGFATWAEQKIVDQWKPSFGARLEAVAGIQGVMDVDALHSARAIREPVVSTGEAMESFDGITYQKGAAVLRMIEQWIGEDTFQKGVRDYIHANAWKNAKAEDLLRALDLASNKNVTQLASGFLDHTGVPMLSLATTCDDKKKTATVTIKQSPWKPLGAARDEKSSAAKWIVPVCFLAEGASPKSANMCATVGPESTSKDLATGKCPSWIYPNANEAGYFRFVLEPKALAQLVKIHSSLDVANRVGLASNMWAQVRAGVLAPDAYLELLPQFDHDDDRHVVDVVIRSLYGIRTSLVDEAALPGFRAYALARLAPHRQGGFEAAKKGRESEDLALMRRDVLDALGELAEDEATLKEADLLTQKWLKDPTSMSGDTAESALTLGSRHAGVARLDALRAAAKNAKTPQDRLLALYGMGSFADAEVLKQALDVALTDEVRVSELGAVLGSAEQHRPSRPIVWAWVKAHYDALRAKMAGPLGRNIVFTARIMCTQADLDDARAFLTPRVKDIEGAKRPYDEALEQAGLCVALRGQGAGAVTKYLTKK
jgi:alanyl aminopeptidase